MKLTTKSSAGIHRAKCYCLALILGLLLSSCSPDTANRSQERGTPVQVNEQEFTVSLITDDQGFIVSPRNLRVLNLRAYPGEEQVTLSWRNPPATDVAITGFTLNYRRGEGQLVRELHQFAAGAPQLRPNAYATTVIDNLNAGGNYAFGVSLLAGTTIYPAAAVVDSNGMERPSITLGSNADGDEYLDVDDLCDATPRSYYLNLRDSDTDGCYGGANFEDSFPEDATRGGLEETTAVPPSLAIEANNLMVRNLRAFPGAGMVTLSWTNPDSRNIRGFVISSRHVDAPTATLHSRRDLNVAANANVTANLTGLSPLNGNYNYTFGVQVDAGAGSYGTPAIAYGDGGVRDVIVLGPNVDGDEYRDDDDLCDSTPRSTFSLPDADNDGCYGASDAGGEDIDDNNNTLASMNDTDGDSVLNNVDNCPMIFNPQQTNTDNSTGVRPAGHPAAHPEAESDGLGDVCDDDDDGDGDLDAADNCPFHYNPEQLSHLDSTNMTGDVCHPNFADEDGDRVHDGVDNCPMIPNTDQADTVVAGGPGDACDPLADPDNDQVIGAADNCPFVYNPIPEGQTVQANADSDGMGDACDEDDDNDGVLDFCDATRTTADDGGDFDNDNENALVSMGGAVNDIDCDGDQLIEIYTAEQLHNVRYNLAGTSYTNGSGAQGVSVTTGCGGNLSEPATTTCDGYELAAEIDLLPDYPNWQPIGHCSLSNNGHNCFTGPRFSGTFDGNGRTISNISISIAGTTAGVGFFGAVNEGGLRNMTLVNVNVSAPVSNRVGGLVGALLRPNGDIRDINVVARSIRGNNKVGGLVGDPVVNAIFRRNSVTAVSVIGNSEVGGFLGDGGSSTVDFYDNNVMLTNNVTIGGNPAPNRRFAGTGLSGRRSGNRCTIGTAAPVDCNP